MKKQKFTTRDMVIVGLMSAVVYAATLLRVEIPTPMGKTMIHMATVACLIYGWASSAPFTLVFKFVIGFLAGLITGGKAQKTPRTFLACAAGGYAYSILYLTKDFVRDLLLGGAMETAIADVSVKAVTSLTNGTLAIIIATLLAPVLRAALDRAGLRLVRQ